MARLLVIGSSNTDLTVRLPVLPERGQTVLGGTLLIGPGGKGANQAVAARRAGAEVVFITSVGDDDFGRQALEGYRAEGLDIAHVRVREGVASGGALILVGEGGENMIGVAPGANHHLPSEDIDALPDSLFAPGGLLLIAGLEIPLPAVGQAVRRANSAGMTVLLNPAPVDDALTVSDWVRFVDLITPNRGELGRLTGLPTGSMAEVAAAGRALTAQGPKRVLATLGSEGCLAIEPERAFHFPALSVEAIDTVGAGDAFSGVLAVALAEGYPLESAVRWATAAAALAVTQPGAQSALPSREAIERLAANAPPARPIAFAD